VTAVDDCGCIFKGPKGNVLTFQGLSWYDGLLSSYYRQQLRASSENDAMKHRMGRCRTRQENKIHALNSRGVQAYPPCSTVIRAEARVAHLR